MRSKSFEQIELYFEIVEKMKILAVGLELINLKPDFVVK